MNYSLGPEYSAKVLFEMQISYNGFSYLLIYGKHINGYFCCVPGWKWGCEMAMPGEVGYNARKLMVAGADKDVAFALSDAIKEYSDRMVK